MSETSSIKAHGGVLDRVAIGVSALCLVHCLATAVLLGLLSSAAGFFGSHLVHEVGLAIAILLGVVALGRGILEHRRFLPAAVAGLGLGMMGGALALPHGLYETAMTMVGVLLLALGHWLNRLSLV